MFRENGDEVTTDVYLLFESLALVLDVRREPKGEPVGRGRLNSDVRGRLRLNRLPLLSVVDASVVVVVVVVLVEGDIAVVGDVATALVSPMDAMSSSSLREDESDIAEECISSEVAVDACEERDDGDEGSDDDGSD